MGTRESTLVPQTTIIELCWLPVTPVWIVSRRCCDIRWMTCFPSPSRLDSAGRCSTSKARSLALRNRFLATDHVLPHPPIDYQRYAVRHQNFLNHRRQVHQRMERRGLPWGDTVTTI